MQAMQSMQDPVCDIDTMVPCKCNHGHDLPSWLTACAHAATRHYLFDHSFISIIILLCNVSAGLVLLQLQAQGLHVAESPM